MKFTIIGLTILSLLIAPQVFSLGVDPSSSEINSFKSSVNENFDALTNSVPDFSRDYDFQQFSPDFSKVINDFTQLFNQLLKAADETASAIGTFFSNPGVLIFGEEQYTTDPSTLGYIPTGRFSQILWESTFRSNRGVVLNVLSPEEITYLKLPTTINDLTNNWFQYHFFLLRNILIDKSILEWILIQHP
jgi:hypothetical protein